MTKLKCPKCGEVWEDDDPTVEESEEDLCCACETELIHSGRTSMGNSESGMACKGAPTRTINTGNGRMSECRACGTRVSWDLVDHPLFGFKSGCSHGS